MGTARVLLAVDLSYQTYRATAANPKLENAEGEFTGGLYGFLVTIAKMIRETQATDVVVCEDRKPYKRSETYPQYKQLRKSTQDPVLKERFELSKPQVMDACRVIGLPFVAEPGFEYDDCVAALGRQHRGRFDVVYTGTNDSDLFQLLDWSNFRVYRKDLDDVMHREKLLKETGLTPDQFMLATALTGTHNDIEGIKGVGLVTAIKAIRDPAIMRGYRERHGAMIDRNLGLIQLPHPDFPKRISLPGPTRSFRANDLYRFLARYDISATQSMLDSFSRVCP